MKNRRFIRFLTIFITAGVLSACSTMYTPALNTTDISKVDFSKSMKKGEDCITYLLFFFGPFGNASAVTAAKNGGISKAEVIDYQVNHYFLFSQGCIIVHGN